MIKITEKELNKILDQAYEHGLNNSWKTPFEIWKQKSIIKLKGKNNENTC